MKALSRNSFSAAVLNSFLEFGGGRFASTNAAVAANPAGVVKKTPTTTASTVSRNTVKQTNVPTANKPAQNSAVVPKIVSFVDIQQMVYDELRNTKKLAGAQWSRFPRLNEILKGHRLGEMTVFTGTTGVGKTTFMSEYSLDLCQTGNVRTLWCSFEIPYVRLAKTMLHQYSRINLRKDLPSFAAVATEFQRLPMHFLNIHGPASRMQDVFTTLYSSIQQHGIQHVIVDNLQFMIGLGSANSSVLDRFHEQDKVVQQLRQFATQTKCHVTLVVHPRKEAGDELLTVQSIYGGGKVTQEADNVMILQKKKTDFTNPPRTMYFVEVCKNRFDGELGWVPLHYDKGTFCMSNNQTSSHIVIPGNAVLQASVSLEGIRKPSAGASDSNDQKYFDADIVVEDDPDGAISYLS